MKKVRNQKLNTLSKRMKQKTKTKKKKKSAPRPRAQFGPVSMVTTAPVAMGNSIRGSSSHVTNIKNGVSVTGRDFMFSPIGSVASVTNWTMIGGTPLAPCAFGDTVLRQYMQMYQKYRWKRITAYYITSSGTSSTGDVMFYRAKNRDSVYINQTSSFLLPFVISDPDTIIGPQWTNHAASMTVQGTWKSTDYGMNSDINEFADGEIFLLAKTVTTDSPGYVLFDYQIEFAELQISPRLLSLPMPRAQYYNTVLGGTSVAMTNTTVIKLVCQGTTISGAAASTPPGIAVGDIYKMIVDKTNSAAVPNGILRVDADLGADNRVGIDLVDGTTLYVVNTSNGFLWFENVSSAYAGANPLKYTATNTANIAVQVWLSLVGTVSNTNTNPNF